MCKILQILHFPNCLIFQERRKIDLEVIDSELLKKELLHVFYAKENVKL